MHLPRCRRWWSCHWRDDVNNDARWWLMVTHTNYCSCTYHYSISIDDEFNLCGWPDEVVVGRMMAQVCRRWCTTVMTMIIGQIMAQWCRRWWSCHRPDDGTTMPSEFYQYMKSSLAGWWHDDADYDEVIVSRMMARQCRPSSINIWSRCCPDDGTMMPMMMNSSSAGWWHDNANDATRVLSISTKSNNYDHRAVDVVVVVVC